MLKVVLENTQVNMSLMFMVLYPDQGFSILTLMKSGSNNCLQWWLYRAS